MDLTKHSVVCDTRTGTVIFYPISTSAQSTTLEFRPTREFHAFQVVSNECSSFQFIFFQEKTHPVKIYDSAEITLTCEASHEPTIGNY